MGKGDSGGGLGQIPHGQELADMFYGSMQNVQQRQNPYGGGGAKYNPFYMPNIGNYDQASSRIFGGRQPQMFQPFTERAQAQPTTRARPRSMPFNLQGGGG